MATYAPIDITTLPDEAQNMGDAVAEFLITPNQPWIVAGLIGVAGLIFFVLGVSVLVNNTTSAWVPAAFGGILIAVSAWQFYKIIRIRDLRVVVMEKGFVRVGGGKWDVVLWDNITGIYQAITEHVTHHRMYGISLGTTQRGTTHTYIIWTRDGIRVVLNDSLIKVATLGSMIQRYATENMLPDYIEAYNDGDELEFYELQLSKRGITRGKDSLPWSQVQAVLLERGYIHIRRFGEHKSWAVQAVARTPNLYVFLHIVSKLAGVAITSPV